MTRLAEFLYPLPAERSATSIVKWWESRRPAYNLFVGSAGLVTLVVHQLGMLVTGFGSFGTVPWGAVLVFGLGANLCYLMGPFVEVVLEKLFGRELMPVGPVLYRMGLTFSVGLALFPALLIVVIVLLSVLGILT